MKETIIVTEDPAVAIAREDGENNGMMNTFLILALVVIAMVAGAFVWHPWTTGTVASPTTIIQAPAQQAAPPANNTTIINPPANNTTVNPPANNTTIVNPPAAAPEPAAT